MRNESLWVLCFRRPLSFVELDAKRRNKWIQSLPIKVEGLEVQVLDLMPSERFNRSIAAEVTERAFGMISAKEIRFVTVNRIKRD